MFKECQWHSVQFNHFLCTELCAGQCAVESFAIIIILKLNPYKQVIAPTAVWYIEYKENS